MRSDAKFNISKASKIEFNFWALLLLVCTLAISSSAVAVRWYALPFLKDHQNELLKTRTMDTARNLDAFFAKNKIFLKFIASDSTVVSQSMGYFENPDYLTNLIEGLSPPENISWIALYDAFGDEIGSYTSKDAANLSTDRVFSDEQISRFINAEVVAAETVDHHVLLQVSEQKIHLILALPILYNGLKEGALIAKLTVDFEAVIPSTEVEEKTELFHLNDALHFIGAPGVAVLDELHLAIQLTPNTEALEAAGQSLLKNTLTAIGVVLFGTFSLFAVLGRSTIVAPHKKLESQTSELEATTRKLWWQKKELSELAAIAERANDSMVVTDIEGKITWTNPSFERLTGYCFEEVKGKKPGEFLQGAETDPETVENIRKALNQKEPIKAEILNYRKDGSTYWVSISMSPLLSDEDVPYAFVAISGDISEQRAQREAIEAANKEIEHQASHDTLTGLPNRRALDAELADRSAERIPTTVLRIDLDHFKYVNDTLGHAAGDFALCEVAKIMREETRSHDLPARVGGDEFVCLLAPGRTSEDALILAERILNRIREPKEFNKKTIRFGASFGVASSRDNLLKIHDLLIGADAALYEAKEQGRNRANLYTPDLHEQVQAQRVLAQELRLAVINEEFEPFFHPQFDAKTHEIVGLETLARWPSPVLGMIPPDSFLKVAEQLSLVSSIDDIIFKKATSQIKTLREEGYDISRVAFNVTAERVEDPNVLDRIKKHKTDGLQIAFEVLESVLIEEQGDRFKFGLDQLRELGIEIEIDDFGSGHASIVGLMQLQPDTMKIDRRLVERVIVDPVSQGVLRAIVDIGKQMDLSIVAEGVETMEHATILNEIGVDILQGFAFCKPMSQSDLRDFITNYRPHTTSRVA